MTKNYTLTTTTGADGPWKESADKFPFSSELSSVSSVVDIRGMARTGLFGTRPTRTLNSRRVCLMERKVSSE